MSLKLHPDRHLPGAYTYLRLTEPFSSWDLPEADEIKFVVTNESGAYGWFRPEDGVPTIGVSAKNIGSTDYLLPLMGHEMIHLYQWLAKTTTSNTQHNAEFRRLAKKVCRAHEWSEKEFGFVS